jgi:hypothetical protein
MGIELSPNLKGAAQNLDYTETIFGAVTGLPTNPPDRLGWNENLRVIPSSVFQSVTVEIGSTSTLKMGPVAGSSYSFDIVNNSVFTRDLELLLDLNVAAMNTLADSMALRAIGKFSSGATAGAAIASLAGGKFGVEVAGGAGVGTISELSGILIESPSIVNNGVTTPSVAGLRIRNQGAGNNAIKTGTGIVDIGGTLTVSGLAQSAGGLYSTAGGVHSYGTPQYSTYTLRNAAGSIRWAQIQENAEGGSDTGFDWSLGAYTNAGALIDRPISIARAAGNPVILSRTLRLPTSTVAALPAGVAGQKAFVTNALAPAFGAAVAGGGAVGVPVYHDGVNWKVG